MSKKREEKVPDEAETHEKKQFDAKFAEDEPEQESVASAFGERHSELVPPQTGEMTNFLAEVREEDLDTDPSHVETNEKKQFEAKAAQQVADEVEDAPVKPKKRKKKAKAKVKAPEAKAPTASEAASTWKPASWQATTNTSTTQTPPTSTKKESA